MLRGFIVGVIVGFAALAGLMVLFPMSVQMPATPEAGAVEGGASVDDAGESPAAETPTPGTTEPAAPEAAPEAPAGEEAAPKDQTRAPSEAPSAVASAGAAAEGADQVAVEAPEPAAGVEVGAEVANSLHLPTVARPEDTLKSPVAASDQLPAWRRNAVAFDVTDGRPLLAIVLTASGASPAVNAKLNAIGAPLTLAVSPAKPDSADAARRYRRAGYETLLLLSFTPSEIGGFKPGLSDAEIAAAVRNLIENFDSVVGFANPGAPKNTKMRVARAVMRELAAAGLSYLHGDGAAIGAEVRAAEENAVPMARHVRVLDPGLKTPEILKVLDLAAFDARRRGAAVAMGAPTEAMVEALAEWAKDNDGRAARLAPFSAVLDRLGQKD